MTKIQSPNKFQCPITNNQAGSLFGNWNLGIGHCLVIGYCILVICMTLQGCASFHWAVSDSDVARQNKTRLEKLSTGMSKADALRLMGTQAQKARTVYYEYGNQWEFPMDDLEIRNPYKVEVMKGKENKSYEIVYYYTTVKKLDGAIADDELTPLVFENERLIGWGDRFLKELIQKEELHQEFPSSALVA